ncbi:MAG TPA: phosphoglycerate mutase (2,3-diphosphoglycerate-independent), partial [Candidatus Omnitrophica bacterium]|nr:phosphoglycerate mutase (2,3-diphosphoglycerate-independent) [Candidatus Omnitrophota bacterium]
IIFYNIRGEREVELTESLTDKKFSNFRTKSNLNINFVTMIEYDKKLKVKVGFPPEERLKDTLSETITNNHLKQVKISESEKAIHVSYFFNGKLKEPFPNEERIVIPSPQVDSYNKKPEMSISQVTEAVVDKLTKNCYQFILANFANIDVIGHIENESAVIKAVESVDKHLGVVVEAAKKTGVTTAITADHGTVEKWLYPGGTIDTGHTNSPVPFILFGSESDMNKLRDNGELSDVAPTVLQLMGIEKPHLMKGKSLIKKGSYKPQRVLLLILDGWGVNSKQEGNLTAQASTPVMDYLKRHYPYTELKASGKAVGMPEGTVGNSEAGHLHLGAGRRVLSDRVRIDRAIEDGSFFENEAFLWAVRGAKRDNVALHLLGIVSFYSSHGWVKHLFSLLELARREGLEEVYIHAMLGRRGEIPESGVRYISEVERETERIGTGKVVSVIGRFWSLDREENWDRIEKTYRMLVYG